MAKRRTKKKPVKRKKKKSGCAIWFIPLILGLLLFFSNEKVRDSFNNFVQSLKGKPTAPVKQKNHNDNKVIKNIIMDDIKNRQPDLISKIGKKLKNKSKKQKKIIKIDSSIKKTTTAIAPKTSKLISTKIYFIRYNSRKDLFALIPVSRKIDKNSSPAYTTLRSLFNGPSKGELKKGYRSLIPSVAKINKMQVKKGILHLDLSMAFLTKKQKLGREGLLLQIYQVVNSMANFSTIKGIRFSFDGKIVATSGGDGVRLNKMFYFKKNPLI